MTTSLKSLEGTWDVQTTKGQPGSWAQSSDRPPNLCQVWVLSTDSSERHRGIKLCMKTTFKLFFLWRKLWFTSRPSNLTSLPCKMHEYIYKSYSIKNSLAYENKDKLDKNIFRHNFSSSLKPHSRNAMQSRLPEELVVKNILRGAEHFLWMELFFLRLKEKRSKSNI